MDQALPCASPVRHDRVHPVQSRPSDAVMLLVCTACASCVRAVADLKHESNKTTLGTDDVVPAPRLSPSLSHFLASLPPSALCSLPS
eukprot:1477426-Rhodomonas_salina.2